MKNDKARSRRRARNNLEELATKCLPPAASVLVRDAQLEDEFDWIRAVIMARSPMVRWAYCRISARVKVVPN